jgi:uncharacterized protein YndB with AHSA1/START domain
MPTEEPIRQAVTVPVPVEQAFAAFVDLASWWPREYTWAGDTLEDIGIAPHREGGHCFEQGPHGFTCHWGRVLAWDPPTRLVLTWQIGPDRVPEPNPAKASEVEVRLHPTGPSGTPGSSSSTATSPATATPATAPARPWPPPRAGRSSSPATPPWLSGSSFRPGRREAPGHGVRWLLMVALTSAAPLVPLATTRRCSPTGTRARVYTLAYRAQDQAGNAATCQTTVRVPR